MTQVARGLAFLSLALIFACAKSTGPDVHPADGGVVVTVDAGGGPDSANPGTGAFWADCETNADCQSNVCFKGSTGLDPGHCTQLCSGFDCPDNYECKQVPIGAAQLEVCVPAVDTFCLHCSEHSDCGDSQDLCISLTAGMFCLIDCAVDPTVCPTGFACQMIEGVGDFPVKQCMPLNGVCCVDGDGDSRGVGDGCIGPDCDDTNNKIYPDNPEVCDGFDNDCNGSTDDNPTDCLPASCTLGAFGYYEQPAEPCESAHCTHKDPVLCGLYTCDGGADQGDKCATACVDNTVCAPGAHCKDMVCVADLPNGDPCGDSFECRSQHCQNDFCCDNGDCCSMDSDCPTFGTVAAMCDNPATCQGTRGSAVCLNFTCGSTSGVADDSGCTATTLANDCGWYLPIYCNGTADQAPPSCPTTCTTDADCDANAFCDHKNGNTCRQDVTNGSACDHDEMCASAHCGNGYCCFSGDCCQTADNCPPEYTGEATCTLPTACQGERNEAQCADGQCTTAMNVDDDSACGTDQVASDCGPYKPIFCDGSSVQTPPTCPTSCSNDLACDDDAYCNSSGVCVPDEPDGGNCKGDQQCQADHCQNGHCCVDGDCCAIDMDCLTYDRDPVCESQDMCQGTRIDGVCTPENNCTSATMDDDSGCAGLKSNDCGPYPAVRCTTGMEQPPDQQAQCPITCNGDDECDASAYCDLGNHTCQPKTGQGGYCQSQTECGPGLFCVDNVCCDSACGGACKACNIAGLEGTCSNIGDGQDPDAECPGMTCAGYYAGWTSNICFTKADVSDAQASCNGAGGCRTVAQECGAQTAIGNLAVSCANNICITPNLGTCSGSTVGQCDPTNPGFDYCGTGACARSTPQCIGGVRQTCTPGNPTTETCNGTDDDCNGQIDNGLADGVESNNDCNTIRGLLSVGSQGSDNTVTYTSLNLYPQGDEDLFYVYAHETDDSCNDCGWLDEDYLFKATLTVPGGSGSYKVCLSGSCAGLYGNNCTTVGAGGSGTVTYGGSDELDGACASSEAWYVYIRVAPVGAPGNSCNNYALTYKLEANHCY